MHNRVCNIWDLQQVCRADDSKVGCRGFFDFAAGLLLQNPQRAELWLSEAGH